MRLEQYKNLKELKVTMTYMCEKNIDQRWNDKDGVVEPKVGCPYDDGECLCSETEEYNECEYLIKEMTEEWKKTEGGNPGRCDEPSCAHWITCC